VPLTVYQNRRFDADLLTVRAVIDSGEVGRVTRFEQYTPSGGIPSSGGGILLDLGAHIADQALLLFGPVMSVYAELDDAGGRPGRFFIALRHGGVWSHTWQAISYCTARRAPGSGCSARWSVNHGDARRSQERSERRVGGLVCRVLKVSGRYLLWFEAIWR